MRDPDSWLPPAEERRRDYTNFPTHIHGYLVCNTTSARSHVARSMHLSSVQNTSFLSRQRREWRKDSCIRGYVVYEGIWRELTERGASFFSSSGQKQKKGRKQKVRRQIEGNRGKR